MFLLLLVCSFVRLLVRLGEDRNVQQNVQQTEGRVKRENTDYKLRIFLSIS